MNHDLLKTYIKEILSEIQDYRVPTQLISKDTGEKIDKESADKEEEIDEMGVGGITGFTAPLGSDSFKSKKRRKLDWK